MSKQVFEKLSGEQITPELLQEAAVLFSENYGTWPAQRATTETAYKPARRVKLSAALLKKRYLPNPGACSYVKVTVDDQLAGNVFACRWGPENQSVCWITQLVVHRGFRERGLAIGLLNQLREDNDDIYGLMSSHPAACLAAAKAYGRSITTVSLDFIKNHAERIMEMSPIDYVKNAKLRGSLFTKAGHADGLVSSVDTGFRVDHAEPLEALEWVKQELDWPLGELHDGHEFLLILPARRRPRSVPQFMSRLEHVS